MARGLDQPHLRNVLDVEEGSDAAPQLCGELRYFGNHTAARTVLLDGWVSESLAQQMNLIVLPRDFAKALAFGKLH